MDAAPTLERGECYMPFQPPDCSLTVGDSLGWIFVVFQVGWALGWSMMLFFYVVGVVGPGFRQSSFFLATVALLPLLEVIRAYNPAGLKKDEPGTSEFLRVFFWCACGWATFEVCFLLIAILGVSASATRWRMPPSPTLWQYATMGLPLSPRIQLVRLAAHLSMWVILFGLSGKFFLFCFVFKLVSGLFQVLLFAASVDQVAHRERASNPDFCAWHDCCLFHVDAVDKHCHHAAAAAQSEGSLARPLASHLAVWTAA
eukprot:TRINITY_DN3440_c0_g1_i1.p1 TRINITY_DN3440_c0_g1~~TRINITY_DN3440_c0_g1_i1.p1  ORF type:complete len:257 (-),score=55.13 TRINITY_DN3440_c0_g1_i1:374-1144(-)